MARVLVTGGTGFVGAHCLIQLLAGHEVRTTIRDPARESDVRAMLREGGAREAGERLTMFRADLNADAGWAEAVAGCDYVLHVASPYPSTVPKNENELIAPARDGALRVLRAARDAACKVPTRPLPNWLMRAVALFDPAVKQVLPELGNHKNASNEKARRQLGWAPRSPREAVTATARSLWELGLLRSGLADNSGRRALHVAAGHGQDRFDTAKK